MLYYETPPNSNLIRLQYTTPPTPGQQAAFERARTRWGQVITERLELSDIDGELTDQIVVTVDLSFIDGSGGIVGLAKPDSLRPSVRTKTGSMTFDPADLDDFEASGLLDEVIFHEMGHVLGFISFVFDFWGYIQDAGTATSRFTGPNARREYGVLLGTNVDTDVPLETMMGAGGSNDSHWSESVFDKEIMTPTFDNISYLSRLTIAVLDDMGYVVDYSQADNYFIGALRSEVRSESEYTYRCSSCNKKNNL